MTLHKDPEMGQHSHSHLWRTLLQAVEQSPTTVVITDPEGRIEYANQRLTELTGYTLDEVKGKTPRIFKSGHTDPKVYERLWETIRSGHIWRGELLNKKKNNALFWEDMNIAPVFDEHNIITHFVAVKEDITVRKEVEQALWESEERFHTTFEQVAVGIAHIAPEGHCLVINQKFCQLLGYTCDEMLGHTFQEIIHPDDVEIDQTQIQQILAHEIETYSVEKRYIRKDQSIQWVQLTVSLAWDAAGHPRYFIWVVQDIGTRKAAFSALQQANQELDRLHQTLAYQNTLLEQAVNERTQQLRRLNDRMATILNSTSDAILLIDAENSIENSNAAFERLFGYAPDESDGQPLQLISELTCIARLIQTARTARESGQPQRIQIMAQCKNGHTFDVDIALAPVEDNTGHIICSIRDITHLKEIERAKDAFISVVSHELRTPITSIALSSETLSHYYERLSDEKRLQKVAQIRQQAVVMTELVTSILDTARFDGRHKRETDAIVDMQQVLQEVVAEMAPQAEKNAQSIEIVASIGTTIVAADHADLSRIWRNLISNAIKYSGEGSRLKIRLYPPNSNERALPLDMLDDQTRTEITSGNHVVGCVADDGPGIDEHDLPQLFTRFFRGRASTTNIPGTGLGLSLVKEILHIYGGDIAVQSVPGAGAIFCFWLPVGGG